MRSKKRM